MSSTSVLRPKLRVLLALADARTRQESLDALRDVAEVLAVDDAAQLEAELKSGRWQALAVDFRQDLIRQARRLCPSIHLIHFGPEIPESLLVMSDGLARLYHVESAAELSTRVHQLSRPARSAMARHPMTGVTVVWRDARTSYPVIDLSNDGLSFAVRPGSGIERLRTGTLLEDVEVMAHRRLLMDGVSLVIRHLTVRDREYHVGCSFLDPHGQGQPLPPVGVEDRMVCAGLLRLALESEGVMLRAESDPERFIHVEGGELDASYRVWTLPGQANQLPASEVVHGHFEVAGTIYRFLSPVLSTSPLQLAVPRVLRTEQQRFANRHRLREGVGRGVSLSNPLSGQPMERPVFDLSSAGISVQIDPTKDLLPPGMYLPRLVLSLDEGRTLTVQGKVRNVRLAEGSPPTARCGISLEGLTDDERLLLAESVVRQVLPQLQDGRTTPFSELLELFTASGLVPKERAESLSPTLRTIQENYEKLTARPNTLITVAVVRSEGKLSAHASSVRVYRNSWYLQHFAAVGMSDATYVLSLGAMELFGQIPELEYWKMNFLAANKWPARLVGGFGKRVFDPELADLRPIHMVTVPATGELSVRGDGTVEVQPASRQDLGWVEQFLVQHEAPVLLRSDDLSVGELELGSLSMVYQRVGLERLRRVFVAYEKNEPVGFALAELAPLGLNLTESLSSSTFYLTRPDPTWAIRAPLMRALQKFYAGHGRPFYRHMIRAAEADEYRAQGFAMTPPAMSWTCHRSLFRRVVDHVGDTFENVLERLRGRS